LPQLRRAGKARGSGPDTRDALMSLCPFTQRDGSAGIVVGFDGKPLQTSNLNCLFATTVHDAGAFAQDLDRTDAAAARAQYIRLQYGSRRSAYIAGCNLFDEARHVNVGRTGAHAWRVKAVQATVSLHCRLPDIEWWMQVWK